jgi:hypothetical protein
MAKTSNQKQQDLRQRRARLGLKRREYYLTDREHESVKRLVKGWRADK